MNRFLFATNNVVNGTKLFSFILKYSYDRNTEFNDHYNQAVNAIELGYFVLTTRNDIFDVSKDAYDIGMEFIGNIPISHPVKSKDFRIFRVTLEPGYDKKRLKIILLAYLEKYTEEQINHMLFRGSFNLGFPEDNLYLVLRDCGVSVKNIDVEEVRQHLKELIK